MSIDTKLRVATVGLLVAVVVLLGVVTLRGPVGVATSGWHGPTPEQIQIANLAHLNALYQSVSNRSQIYENSKYEIEQRTKQGESLPGDKESLEKIKATLSILDQQRTGFRKMQINAFSSVGLPASDASN